MGGSRNIPSTHEPRPAFKFGIERSAHFDNRAALEVPLLG
jgi:hypothetical protein